MIDRCEEKERLYRKYFDCNHDNKRPVAYYGKIIEHIAGIGLPPSQQLAKIVIDNVACVECQKKFDPEEFYDFCFKEEGWE